MTGKRKGGSDRIEQGTDDRTGERKHSRAERGGTKGQRKGGGGSSRIEQGTVDRTERGQMTGQRKETISVKGEEE